MVVLALVGSFDTLAEVVEVIVQEVVGHDVEQLHHLVRLLLSEHLHP